MAQDPYRYFRPEARNLLDQFAQGILELEKNGSSAGAVARLLRLAHTLKGAARVVRQAAIAERAHAIEDMLAPFRDRAETIGRETIDAMLAHLDEIGSRIVALAPADGGAGRNSGKAGAEDKPDHGGEKAAALPDTARVIGADTADMDAVLDQVSETHARLIGVRRNADAIEQIGHLAELLAAQIANNGRTGRARTLALADELSRKAANLATAFETAVTQVDRELRQLRDAAEALRLVSVDTVLRALKRTARDSARALAKQVIFEGAGGDIRLDAEVLGVVQNALIQIVRNAVAHGIEPDDERLAAGKPAAGRVTVGVFRRGSQIAFECRDDGRGIDLGAVRKAATERGLLDPGARDLTAENLMRVLLRGGISTAASVTDMSGRGVGLDVVREALDRLGGEVVVRSEPGRGTTFELVIPRSITAITALLVAAERGVAAMALPLDGVRKIVRLSAGDISCAADGASILHEGRAIPFMTLAAAVHGTQGPAAARTAIIVAAADGMAADDMAAIGVERLLGTARMVVRPLPDGLEAGAVVVGAALDGEGNPQLILDPAALAAAAAAAAARHGMHPDKADAAPAKRPVLVVDDSLTTRMLEKSILESAGYDVDVASSGEEGLDLARRKSFALILCDVEMPGIDGFTFVERIRADAALRNVPAILVTSRAATADRQRGRDVGAHGYIVKSEFNQAELLAMIEPMVR